MRAFLDANVIVSVLNKEYPLFTYSSRLLSLNNQRGFEMFTSPICLAIAFYFSEKKSGTTVARKKIGALCRNIGITTVDYEITMKTINNKSIHDFEDGLQYYSAKGSICDCIVTEDVGDFYYSKIEVLETKSFMEKYIFI